MCPREYESWDAYLKGSIKLPDIDWDANREEPPTTKKALKKARRRTEALNRLYSSDRAQPVHSAWLTIHHPECLPLVKAMARVIGAERQLGQGNLTDMSDLADLQTLRSVISTSSQVHRQHQLMSKALSKSINTKI